MFTQINNSKSKWRDPYSHLTAFVQPVCSISVRTYNQCLHACSQNLQLFWIAGLHVHWHLYSFLMSQNFIQIPRWSFLLPVDFDHVVQYNTLVTTDPAELKVVHYWSKSSNMLNKLQNGLSCTALSFCTHGQHQNACGQSIIIQNTDVQKYILHIIIMLIECEGSKLYCSCSAFIIKLQQNVLQFCF